MLNVGTGHVLSSQEGAPHVVTNPATYSFAAPSLAVEEGVLAHWTRVTDDDVTSGGASIAASFSMGIRPLSAIEKRWWL